MDIQAIKNNPFFILHASLDDNYAALQEKAGTAILLEGAIDAEKALADLLHPQKRLLAELNWFPKTPQSEIEKLLDFSEKGGVLPDFQTDSKIALINGCRCILSRWPQEYSEGLAGTGLCIAGVLRELSWEMVVKELNESRKISGFPEIINYEVAASHFLEQINEILQEFLKNLKKAPEEEAQKAVLYLADAYSGTDLSYAKNLYIQKIVDSFTLTVSDKAEDILRAIRSMIAGDAALYAVADKLKKWDALTSAQRRIYKAQGIRNESSFSLLNDLSVFYDKKGKKKDFRTLEGLRERTSFLELMIKVFQDLPEDVLAGHRQFLMKIQKYLSFRERMEQRS